MTEQEALAYLRGRGFNLEAARGGYVVLPYRLHTSPSRLIDTALTLAAADNRRRPKPGNASA